MISFLSVFLLFPASGALPIRRHDFHLADEHLCRCPLSRALIV